MGNKASGNQPQRPLLIKGTTYKEALPCRPIPKGCEDKPPEKYEEWGKHEFPQKKLCHLADHIEELLEAGTLQLTWIDKERIDLDLEYDSKEGLVKKRKPPSLVSYREQEFQFHFVGERHKRAGDKKEDKSKQKVHNWRYRRWEHAQPLDTAHLPPEENIPYYGRTSKSEVWEGNGLENKFKASCPPVETDSEKVYLDEVIMHRDLDYTMNYNTGEITLKAAPELLSKVKVTYVGYGEREPGDPKIGAILEEIEESTGKYKEVTEKGFEHSKEEALHYYYLFNEVVKEAFKEKYEASIKKKKGKVEDFEDSIKEWAVPFPSRRLTLMEKSDVERSTWLSLKCPECNEIWYIRVPSPRAEDPDMRYKETQCPKCGKLVKPEEVTNRSWKILKMVTATLEVDDQLENNIKREMADSYDLSPLVLSFKLDMPKPGQTWITLTEKEALEDPNQLDQVAKELAKHLRNLEICGFSPRLVVRGYADSSASCAYNLDLSERRVQWVIDMLKNRYKIKLDPKPEQIACGKCFADEKRSMPERRKDRVAIVELDAEMPSKKPEKPERLSIMNKVEEAE
jgi:phage FluMu protein Com